MKYQGFSLTYVADGITKTVAASDNTVKVTAARSADGFELKLNTSKPIYIKEIAALFTQDFSKDTVFWANGFQSWTDTREYAITDKMRDRGFLARTAPSSGLSRSGDYDFSKYKKKRGWVHAVSYAYVRNGDNYRVIGSLNENAGYTFIYADMKAGTVRVEKDFEGVLISGEKTAVSLYIIDGAYENVFDRYFDKLGVKPMTDKALKGYTSWYNHYQSISDKIILNDLTALTAATKQINTFQIDDGYQTAVGDWLSINAEKFPNGMKPMADAITSYGLKPGIWLAPYVTQQSSKLIKEHPDWILRYDDGKGKMCRLGGNWGGYYALDFYNPEVRTYIKNVFNTVLNIWGFKLVKLDFLFGAAIIPQHGKSRAEVMHEAMDFIRECVGENQILGCGVPLFPCFNKVEYMRIGSDMGLSWKSNFYQKHLTHREDVSTVHALHNSLTRRHLNGRAFLNDPDVFLLRDYHLNFSMTQKTILGKVIKMTGGVLFTSDDVSRYSPEQKEVFDFILSDEKWTVKNVTFKNGVYTVDYADGSGKADTLRFNVFTGEIL
ncbi:MAG: alpha-galactosidase [Clostridiaceae bacterium]|jgi:alpha-galactosidase|nr:alpha-galactosidase [Clostridiaceae bacterium]